MKLGVSVAGNRMDLKSVPSSQDATRWQFEQSNLDVEAGQWMRV